MSNDLIEQLKLYFNSDEGKEFVKYEQKKYLFMKQHINKYVEKLRNMNSNERNILFEKIKAKYDSSKYYHRWINRGIEPPEDLYGYVLEYGIKYGALNEIKNALFGYDSYIIDNTWVITCWYGQGCAFTFEKI
jgi:hypothetical protein